MPQQNSTQAPVPSQPPAKNQPSNLMEAVGEIFATAFPSAKTVMLMTQLATAASTLNRLSDELTKEVSEIETTLNTLNLGIRAEVRAKNLESIDTYSHWLRLAYGKKAGKWGFIVEELEVDTNDPEGGTCESWLFKDSPREFRLHVVASIPALLDALVKKSDDTADEITKKVKFVKDLAFSFPKTSQQGSKK